MTSRYSINSETPAVLQDIKCGRCASYRQEVDDRGDRCKILVGLTLHVERTFQNVIVLDCVRKGMKASCTTVKIVAMPCGVRSITSVLLMEIR